MLEKKNQKKFFNLNSFLLDDALPLDSCHIVHHQAIGQKLKTALNAQSDRKERHGVKKNNDSGIKLKARGIFFWPHFNSWGVSKLVSRYFATSGTIENARRHLTSLSGLRCLLVSWVKSKISNCARSMKSQVKKCGKIPFVAGRKTVKSWEVAHLDCVGP